MSKWMDATYFSSVFHLQSDHYKDMKPPSFFHYDELNELNLTRDREQEEGVHHHHHHHHHPSMYGNNMDSMDELNSHRSAVSYVAPQSDSLGIEDVARSSRANNYVDVDSIRSEASTNSLRRRRYLKSINETSETHRMKETTAADTCDETHLLGPPRLDGGWGLLYPDDVTGKHNTATYYDEPKLGKKTQIPDGKGFASTQGGRTPSLFLQELAHLSSLMCAVALTTLRNDLDDVESPLGTYIPGQPWPEADPVNLPKEVKQEAFEYSRFSRNIRYLLGMDQTKRSQTIYNAARPLLVIGGVSDNEIAFLQRARGPYAKTQLTWSWLSDFIIREHLAGSMGAVGPPIVSRCVQFLSDGMIFYNHARKIMYTPFPFPHAQLSAFFVLMMIVAIPFLMVQFANEVWLGATLSFLTVTCLAGLHEVARELENPFRNAPNDVPLCTLLAFYNEALITMFAGFHPDAYWDKASVLTKKQGSGKVSSSSSLAVDANDAEDDPLLIPELPAGLNVDETKIGVETPGGSEQAAERQSSAIPQSVDDIDSLKELREMIDNQASKIQELQARVKSRERPQTAPM